MDCQWKGGKVGGGKPSGYSREPPDRSAEILKRPTKHKGGLSVDIDRSTLVNQYNDNSSYHLLPVNPFKGIHREGVDIFR